MINAICIRQSHRNHDTSWNFQHLMANFFLRILIHDPPCESRRPSLMIIGIHVCTARDSKSFTSSKQEGRHRPKILAWIANNTARAWTLVSRSHQHIPFLSKMCPHLVWPYITSLHPRNELKRTACQEERNLMVFFRYSSFGLASKDMFARTQKPISQSCKQGTYNKTHSFHFIPLCAA